MAIILQMGLFDERRYPNVLKGIVERTHSPALQFVFVDTIEQARELEGRIAEDIPHEEQPSVFTMAAGSSSASEAFTALVTGVPPTGTRPVYAKEKEIETELRASHGKCGPCVDDDSMSEKET